VSQPFHNGRLRLRISSLIALAPLFLSPRLLGQDAAPKPTKPSFSASGIHGTTAPSGYSGGATEEHGKQAAGLAATLLESNLLDLVQSAPTIACAQQSSLLHAALTQPRSFDANHRLGVFYLQHQNSALARKYLLLASSLNLQDRNSLLLLAIADVQEHSYADALDTADRILRTAPNEAAAHRVRATVQALTNKDADALAEYGLAAKFDPSESNRFAEGLATLLLGSPSGAEQQFLSATSTRPDSSLLWFGLGMTEAVLNNTAQSIKALLRATELDPDNLLAASLLAQQSGTAAQADSQILARTQALVQRHPTSAIALYNHAIVLARMGRASNAPASLRAATDELNQSVADDSTIAAAHFQLAIVQQDLLQRGDTTVQLESVLSHLRRAIELAPNIPEWHYRLSRAYATDHQPALAAAELQTFQQLKHEQAESATASGLLNDGLPIASIHPSTVCPIASAR